MDTLPLYKRLFALGTSLLLLTFPLIDILEIDTTEVFKNIFVFNSDTGLISSLFIVGFILFIAAFIFRKGIKG